MQSKCLQPITWLKKIVIITCQDTKFHNTVIKAGNMRKCGHISEKVERASKCKRKFSKWITIFYYSHNLVHFPLRQ